MRRAVDCGNRHLLLHRGTADRGRGVYVVGHDRDLRIPESMSRGFFPLPPVNPPTASAMPESLFFLGGRGSALQAGMTIGGLALATDHDGSRFLRDDSQLTAGAFDPRAGEDAPAHRYRAGSPGAPRHSHP
jgi:hypothetical protein